MNKRDKAVHLSHENTSPAQSIFEEKNAHVTPNTSLRIPSAPITHPFH
jgi:hypothetical protein